ncbi:hypothetical protein JG687_00019397, partial [Phytophthora cactorum]
MATFKSKYDIQVLLGGEAVTDRIYYCCKYVKTSGITDDQVQEASAFDDYIFRPLKLEALSVYEFWMKFFRAKRGESTRDDSCFLSGYPLFSNHRVGSRRKQIV